MIKIQFILLFLFSLQNVFSQNVDYNSSEVIKVDSEFSNYSKQFGAKNAFLKYAAVDVVILRRFSYPMIGLDKLKEDYKDDAGGYTLTWEPQYGSIAFSGELGYTYGLWQMDSKDDKGEPVITKGTYVTIWKKDKDGNWKFVLDTGNLGLEPPKK